MVEHERRLHVLSGLTCLFALGPVVWTLRDEPGLGGGPCTECLVPALGLIAPLILPALFVFAQRRDAASHRALVNAASMSAVLGVYAPIVDTLGLVGRPALWGGRWLWDASFLALTCTYWALHWALGRTLKAAPRERSGCLPVSSLVAVCLLTGLFFTFWTLARWARPAANEASTLGSLRAIGMWVTDYAGNRKCGCPGSLAVLPPPAAPSRGDADLAERFKQGQSFLKASYRFEYQPRSPLRDAAPGCQPGFEGYVVTARPLTWGRTGRSSFYMDQTSVIRYTAADRPASADDPKVRP